LRPPRRSAAAETLVPSGLIPNAEMEQASDDGHAPQGFRLVGDADYAYLGTPTQDLSGWGVRLHSGEDRNTDGQLAGALTAKVSGIRPEQRWYRLRIRGLAQSGFAVKRDQLFLQVEFFKSNGQDPLDQITRQFYPQVERERADLKDPATNQNLGAPTWRSYELEFRTPFAEIDSLRVGAGFAEGVGQGKQSEFWIDALELSAIANRDTTQPRAATARPVPTSELKSLVKLGGRWFYDPRGGDPSPPAQFDHTNVGRLHYLAEGLESPFADNTTAWLRKGWLDRAGKLVEQDQFVPDNVSITFTKDHLVVHSKNLPNHPTAVFPDRWRALDGNPNYIQEKDLTWRIPLDPQVDDKHRFMTAGNANLALNGGPIGMAINGVVFFNPFDADAVDAIWRLDRCCGHPSPNEMYHYHKYPVCLNTPWVDDGAGHSPLIGFAFDGFPIYGPYEAAGHLAKDDRKNPLNEFNVHRDELRGWHYHVTPGRFPHLIGGYWGQVDPQNLRRGPPRGRG
jgi:hypothetical protein